MDKSTKAEIKNITNDVDYHLKELDQKLDRIWSLLDSIDEEATEADKDKRRKTGSDSGERDDATQPTQNRSFGGCPSCGSPLQVISQAPLMLECSNARYGNRFLAE